MDELQFPVPSMAVTLEDIEEPIDWTRPSTMWRSVRQKIKNLEVSVQAGPPAGVRAAVCSCCGRELDIRGLPVVVDQSDAVSEPMSLDENMSLDESMSLDENDNLPDRAGVLLCGHLIAWKCYDRWVQKTESMMSPEECILSEESVLEHAAGECPYQGSLHAKNCDCPLRAVILPRNSDTEADVGVSGQVMDGSSQAYRSRPFSLDTMECVPGTWDILDTENYDKASAIQGNCHMINIPLPVFCARHQAVAVERQLKHTLQTAVDVNYVPGVIGSALPMPIPDSVRLEFEAHVHELNEVIRARNRKSPQSQGVWGVWPQYILGTDL
jgi:hypothetical protein